MTNPYRICIVTMGNKMVEVLAAYPNLAAAQAAFPMEYHRAATHLAIIEHWNGARWNVVETYDWLGLRPVAAE